MTATGLFVIMGVRSCRAGAGYCLLGLDCTLDEDFLPDDQGGHCDGLRSAFTPSAHFICCRYNAANRTIPHLPTPANMGQDITDNDLALLSDYTNTNTFSQYGDFPSGSNFAQNAEVSALEADNTVPLESSIQAIQASLPSNFSLETDDNGATTITDISNSFVSDAIKYEEILMTEVVDFSTQDNALESTGHTVEIFTDIYTTTESISGNTEVTSSKYSDTTNTDLKSEEHTITETSVTQIGTQIQNQSVSAYSGVKLSGGGKDSNVVGHDRILSDSGTSSRHNSSLKDKQNESGVELGGTSVSDRAVVEAHLSAVSDSTQFVLPDGKARHRNVEINDDITTVETATQMTYSGTELSVSFDMTGGDGRATNAVSHTDTTTESYYAVTVSETDAEETVSPYVNSMMKTSLQPVFGDTVVPLTAPNKGLQDSTIVVESKSGEASSDLYGDTKLLQEYDENLFVNSSEYSGYQTDSSVSVLPTELEDTLAHTATETLTSATQNVALSRDDITNFLSKSDSTDNKQVPDKEPGTESSWQHFLALTLYKDTMGTDVKTVSSELDKTHTLPQPSRSGPEITNDDLTVSEISNEIPITIPTKFTVHETTRSAAGQTVTTSEEDQGTKPEYIIHTLTREESGTTSITPALRNQDSLSSVLLKTAEGVSVVRKPGNKVVTAGHYQKPGLSEFHETTLSMNTVDIPMQTDKVSSSRTITEHVERVEAQQVNEITTELLPPTTETTVSEKMKTEGSVSFPSTEATAGHQLKSTTQNDNKTTVFIEKDESADNLENVTESVPAATVIYSEIAITSEDTRVLPALFYKEGSSSLSSAVESSVSSSTVESSSHSITAGSSIPSNTVPDVSVPPTGVTKQQTSEQSPLCGAETSGKFHGTKCWLVKFMNPYNSNSSVCAGSYVDSNTIVTSASCVSR